jgi:hypothetical protein
MAATRIQRECGVFGFRRECGDSSVNSETRSTRARTSNPRYVGRSVLSPLSRLMTFSMGRFPWVGTHGYLLTQQPML